MTNYGKVTFRFRVYDLGDKEQYEGIYDDLYLPEHQELAERENLICCEITSDASSALSTFDSVCRLYEGMSHSVDVIADGNVEHVIGGTCDPGDYDYIKDWLKNNNL